MSNKDCFSLVKELNKILAECDELYIKLNGNIHGNKEYADYQKEIEYLFFILQEDKRIKYHGQIHTKCGVNGVCKVWVTFE